MNPAMGQIWSRVVRHRRARGLPIERLRRSVRLALGSLAAWSRRLTGPGGRWALLGLICGTQGLCLSQQAWAWGPRGHSSVAAVAALILANEREQSWLKNHTFDLAYYSNVPDLVWKDLDIAKLEKTEHFFDLDLVKSQLAPGQSGRPWPEERAKFNEQNPQVEGHAGRALWRVAELEKGLAQLSRELRRVDLNSDQRRRLQRQWLVQAGVLGHYLSDLAQPLHVTENYDGQKTGQVGLHRFFELDLVNELYPRLDDFVFAETKKIWPRLRKELANLSPFALAQKLAEESSRVVPQVLSIDKKVGRANRARSVRANKALLIRRLAQGSMYLAELWRRNLGWSYQGDRFDELVVRPAYIPVGQALPDDEVEKTEPSKIEASKIEPGKTEGSKTEEDP